MEEGPEFMETRASRTGALASSFAVPRTRAPAVVRDLQEALEIAETAWRAYP